MSSCLAPQRDWECSELKVVAIDKIKSRFQTVFFYQLKNSTHSSKLHLHFMHSISRKFASATMYAMMPTGNNVAIDAEFFSIFWTFPHNNRCRLQCMRRCGTCATLWLSFAVVIETFSFFYLKNQSELEQRIEKSYSSFAPLPSLKLKDHEVS